MMVMPGSAGRCAEALIDALCPLGRVLGEALHSSTPEERLTPAQYC